MYLRYCGACHGPKAQGDGVAAGVLNPKPTDLTGIAKRNGGEFPSARIAAFIDGTTPMAAHGSAQMPVWGEVLRNEVGPDGTRKQVQSTLMLITEYLRTVQAK